MINKTSRNEARKARHARIRNKVSGTSELPRLCVFRSLKNISVQIIDDEKGVTLVSASSLDKDLNIKNGGMCQFARTFSVEVLQKMLSCDVKLKKPTIDNVQSATRILDNLQFVQEVPAQIKEIGRTISFMLQTSIGEIEHPALHY